MLAEDILIFLRRNGATIRVDDGKIWVKAPGGVLTDELRDEIRNRKPELLEIIREEGQQNGQNPEHDSFLRMLLSEFERQDCALQVTVPWLTDSLWFAPTQAVATVLAAEGVSRGKIWTAAELTDFLSIPGLTTEKVTSIQAIMDEFGGHLAEVRPIEPKGGRAE